jgi:hypothetical protein
MAADNMLEGVIRHTNFKDRLPVLSCARIGWSWYYDIIERKCEGGTAMPTSGSSRRAFVKTMGVVAAAATCGRAAAAKAQEYKPQDQKKLTQAAARYQDHPKENESCGNCPYFVFPKSCVLVEGEISALGWCPIYTTFSPLDRGAHG